MQISEIQQKNLKKNYFIDKCIWVGCLKLALLQEEYLSLAVNVSTKSPKFLNIPERDIFQLNLPRIGEEIL